MGLDLVLRSLIQTSYADPSLESAHVICRLHRNWKSFIGTVQPHHKDMAFIIIIKFVLMTGSQITFRNPNPSQEGDTYS